MPQRIMLDFCNITQCMSGTHSRDDVTIEAAAEAPHRHMRSRCSWVLLCPPPPKEQAMLQTRCGSRRPAHPKRASNHSQAACRRRCCCDVCTCQQAAPLACARLSCIAAAVHRTPRCRCHCHSWRLRPHSHLRLRRVRAPRCCWCSAPRCCCCCCCCCCRRCVHASSANQSLLLGGHVLVHLKQPALGAPGERLACADAQVGVGRDLALKLLLRDECGVGWCDRRQR
jgi:hypothetical protein